MSVIQKQFKIKSKLVILTIQQVKDFCEKCKIPKRNYEIGISNFLNLIYLRQSHQTW